jgi:hypothetical protein
MSGSERSQFIHQKYAPGAGVRGGEPANKQGLPTGFGFVEAAELAVFFRRTVSEQAR